MKHLKSLICLLLALLILSGCAPAAPAQSDASTEPAQTEEAAPTEQTEQVELEAPAEEEATEPEADFITVTDHNDNVVQVPKNAQRIAVCDILPLPSVLCCSLTRRKSWSASRRRACLPRKIAFSLRCIPKF